MNLFLDVAIARNYDSYYDTPIGKEIDEIEKNLITKYIRYFTELPVLELGCGTGHWTEFLVNQGLSITAIDISEAMLKQAKGKKLKQTIFLKADASKLPFADESFGSIISITMLEFTENIQGVLKEINRVLKPEGILILGCLNKNSEIGKSKEKDETFKNAHFFSKAELKSSLSVFGNAEIKECVYLTGASEILDGTMEKYPVEGAFLAAFVRKIKK